MATKLSRTENEELKLSEIDAVRMKRLASMAVSYTDNVKRLNETFSQLASFATKCGGGFRQVCPYNSSMVEIERDDLPRVRAIVGRLTIYGKTIVDDWELDPADRHDNWIWVEVRSRNNEWGQLRFRYKRKLTGRSKCHIETKVSTYKTIVCSAD